MPYLLVDQELMRGGFIQECCLASAWYEVLSVVHMMAMLALFETNLKLIPRDGQNGAEKKVSEGQFHVSTFDSKRQHHLWSSTLCTVIFLLLCSV